MIILEKIWKKLRQFNILLMIKLRYLKQFKYGSLRIMSGFRVVIGKGAKCSIEKAFFNNYCSINCLESIKIGKDCLFGENVKIYDHNHIFSNIDVPISSQGFSTAPIVIGNNVWIGSNCTILKGVTIGDNVVIGANCLIHHDIPSNSIVKNNSNLIVERRN